MDTNEHEAVSVNRLGGVKLLLNRLPEFFNRLRFLRRQIGPVASRRSSNAFSLTQPSPAGRGRKQNAQAQANIPQWYGHTSLPSPNGRGLGEGENSRFQFWSHLPNGLSRALLAIGLIALPHIVRSQDHWAFQPVKRPAVPSSNKTNPIDAFITKTLAEKELQHSPRADRVTLIRRAYLDLTGLPPTPEQVQRFVEGKHTFAQIIDELLASRHYGERWAQHWLDVVRYADTHGYEVNTPRNNAWPYRDYAIRSFNQDKPYNRFILEQLAGDSTDEPAATGFLVAAAALLPGQIGQDEASKRLARQDSLDEIIVGTSDTFLGLTIGCARCHDHKFDPISQRDYYAMQAFFSGVKYGDRPIETEKSRMRQAQAKELEPEINAIDHKLREFEPRAFAKRTIIIDDEDWDLTTHLKEKQGHGSNPKGTKRGYLDDPGDDKRLPNLSRGRYTWWRHKPGEDIFTYDPGAAGRFQVWLSWGAHGSGVHSRDARYVLDRDGVLDTRDDQTEIAKIDQYYFSGISGGETERKPLWSGMFDAGVHVFEPTSRIILRGGDTGTGVTADVIVLQEPNELSAHHPYLRRPVDWLMNVERFNPVRARFVRFTFFDTQDNNHREACIDELEVFSALTNSVNLALAKHGTKPSAVKSVENDRHKLAHINDGRYGNEYSFINGEQNDGWVQLEFTEPHLIDRIAWARDRNGKFRDRLTVRYQIEVALETNEWTAIASNQDRLPLKTPVNAETYDLRNVAEADSSKVKRLVAERTKLSAKHTALSKPNLVYAGMFANSENTFVLRRGDPEQPTERINAHVPKVLGELGLKLDHPEQDRRIALAKWIASPDNPLTARVMVNRIWQFHFGSGLVSTSSDFGRNGAKPSHPELLDWLASEFVSKGWSVKHLHRLIMSSDTYQQSSLKNDRGTKVDADSRLLWRFPSRRLEAEAIRDSLLFVSGNLNTNAGGSGFSFFKSRGGLSGFPPVTDFKPEHLRRMIYQHKIRMEPVPVFGAFDAPDAGQAMPRRKQSTTAIQALNLFNSPFVNDQAAAFAKRVQKEAGENAGAQVKRAFQLAFGRAPRTVEQKAASASVKSHGLGTLCRVLFNSNEFLFLP